jgi:hypothetical protein
MDRRLLFLLVLAGLAGAVVEPAQARIQSDLVCWVPDCEFPVDCDEEDE